MPLSLGQSGLGIVKDLDVKESESSWNYPESGMQVRVSWREDRVFLQMSSDRAGEFTFPVLRETAEMDGWILPLFEGVYVPVGDERWKIHLSEREMNTTADLTMPFLGLKLKNRTVSCVLTNPFNNRLVFQTNNGTLEVRLTHEFTPNNPVKEFGLFFQIGAPSPVQPAKVYRDWLKERGELVSLRDKIKRVPEAQKLLGAAHVYIWGEDLMTPEDVLDWKSFARQIQTSRDSPDSSPGRHIWSLLGDEAQKNLINMAGAEWMDRYSKSLVLSDLNAALLTPEFYNEVAWKTVPAAASVLNGQKPVALPKSHELAALNGRLFYAAFSDVLSAPENWGSGVSPKMVKMFAEAGLDRLWIGSGSWKGFVLRPETVTTAKELGYLVGPYDSYHSIHHPEQKDSWETAQFDLQLYEKGGIVKSDGTRRHGFQKKGYVLSPIAARPYLEKRVNGLMGQFRANSWFIDCDGFGEFFDDYSKDHPATQRTDMQARMSRMAWIRDRFNVVIGTEGCSAGVASTVHFAHGVMTPVIGWGDPDLKDRKSKYFLGAYFPPDEPAVFFKQAPIKQEYRYLFYDGRFRLPLFQTVFHDSVVATHHWSNPSLKFPEVAGEMQLLELLYNVPPLYHLTPGTFRKSREEIIHHYEFFSPLHRELALLPMSDFQWLNDERNVQRTVFGEKVQITANFGEETFQSKEITMEPRSILVEWTDSGEKRKFVVLEKGAERR